MKLTRILAMCISFAANTTTLAHAPPNYAYNETLNSWFESAKQRNGASCCGVADASVEGEMYLFMGKDAVVLEDWKMEGDAYSVQVRGAWYKVGKEGEASIIHNNPVGKAIVWIHGNYMAPLAAGPDGQSPGILCFSPGTMI
jgi:hypothetical protein